VRGFDAHHAAEARRHGGLLGLQQRFGGGLHAAGARVVDGGLRECRYGIRLRVD
jgi:hypothetical protein